MLHSDEWALMAGTDVRTYWMDGTLSGPEGARVHPMALGLHYGAGVFEGIRAYDTPRGTAIFRLDDHLRRFFASAAHYGLNIPYSLEELVAATVATVRAGSLREAYIRPLAFFGEKTVALSPRFTHPTHVLIAVLEFPPLMQDAPGARATISPVEKYSSRALPSTIKGTGHYANSVLALHDAIARGFDEAVLLNEKGDVSEGSGENIFIVSQGIVKTNDASADILYGITRDSVLAIAQREGIPTAIGPISLGDLLAADEAFFTGTAAEVLPILCVDDREFARDAPVTARLRVAYARATRAADDRFLSWLTFVG